MGNRRHRSSNSNNWRLLKMSSNWNGSAGTSSCQRITNTSKISCSSFTHWNRFWRASVCFVWKLYSLHPLISQQWPHKKSQRMLCHIPFCFVFEFWWNTCDFSGPLHRVFRISLLSLSDPDLLSFCLCVASKMFAFGGHKVQCIADTTSTHIFGHFGCCWMLMMMITSYSINRSVTPKSEVSFGLSGFSGYYDWLTVLQRETHQTHCKIVHKTKPVGFRNNEQSNTETKMQQNFH